MAIRPPPPGITESLMTPELMDHYTGNVDLVVISEFGGHKIGEMITDPDVVLQTLMGPDEHKVTKMLKAPPPPPEE